jgi:hypothetical protein
MERFIRSALVALTLLLVVTSLVTSGFVLYSLLQVRQGGLESIAAVRAALAELSGRKIEISIPFRHTFPISAQVPVQQEFVVPIQTTIPISTVARVPVEIPLLGTYQLPVPVEAEIPVDLQVVIPVSQTVAVETSVTLDTEVPVSVETGQLGLDDLLAMLDTALAQVEERLRRPFAFGHER